ncbi:Aminoacyltransferase FemA [Jeotgalicoccus aerolatus]|uniref:Lipid II:glycine glycyltransferase (Peptidoglycan interpeptide bridge formation enzyme) n=1 Tax=Jeotgalicoccus aerolatus TaxID=709510 RepID=A0ABS4HLR5_9STAP|nr:peptidoglycan bridge formation glycyltransferase FemA/FemB family protein [Jeotgalicoccus aerolatus]MBP1951858.1 lipid II:glycine glycyltransferase (peptidoglycan interpeptide bridge formation enzyme) [Jeotgalicoccus aerolatus]GGD94215.1 methicillin resistance protein [Jeotgalicoccus aerolatus]CAD2074966.1 Aminoacyltransferase FemA [Jeotgalicoccus aerolatus]
MEVKPITEAAFKQFEENYTGHMHYFHDELFYDYISNVNETHLLGLFDGDDLIGVSMLSATSVLKKFRLFTSHTGPLIQDFSNERLKFFLEEIDQYAKSHGALQMIHSPYTVYQMRDEDGNVAEDDPQNNRELISLYEDLGYKHHGFTTELITEELLRFQAVIDVDKPLDDILKQMDTTTRYNTRQTETMPLQLKLLDEDEYDKFIQIYKETEERIGFDPVPAEKIKNLLNTLKDRMFLVLTHVNVDDYLKQLEDERDIELDHIAEIEEKAANGTATKREKKRVNEHKEQLASKDKRIKKMEEFKAEFGTELDLSAGMYYYNNHEMVYLFSGSYPELSFFKGTNFATWEMIKKAQEIGVKRFNFFGLTGDFTENAQDYGVYRFKRGFTPYIEELPGTFDKVFNKPVYAIAKKLGKI